MESGNSRPVDPKGPQLSGMLPGTSGAEGKTIIDQRPSFEAIKEHGAKPPRPDPKPDAKVPATLAEAETASLDSEVTVHRAAEGDDDSQQMKLQLNPVPYLADLSPDHGLVHADGGPRYRELAVPSEREESPGDLEAPLSPSEFPPEIESEASWDVTDEESAPLRPPPKPVRPEHRALPRETAHESESNDEYHPPLTEPISASEITKLPDVRRALDALRMGKMAKPLSAEQHTPSEPSPHRGEPAAPSNRPDKQQSLRAPAPLPESPSCRPSTEQGARPTLGLVGISGWLVAAGVLLFVVVVLHFRGALGPRHAHESSARPSASPVVSAPKLDPTALQQIAETPVADLTPEQWVALAGERAKKKLEEVKQLSKDLEANGAEHPGGAVAARLYDAACDQRTAPQALLAMTHLGGTSGPDLIYRAASDARLPADTRELALDLLRTKALRAKSSEALKVVVDLGRAKGCGELEPVVVRALNVGDQRALEALGRLSGERSCGPAKNADCYPCLRKGDLIQRAIAAVRSRQPPV